jgi:hypothetical protein
VRRTRRVTDLALLLVHATGGRPAAPLMKRLGLPQSDDAMLQSLKRQTANHGDPTPVRLVATDNRARGAQGKAGAIQRPQLAPGSNGSLPGSSHPPKLGKIHPN